MIARMDLPVALVALTCFAALTHAAEVEGASSSVLSNDSPFYTSNFGLPVFNNNESLTVGARGTCCSSLSSRWWMWNDSVRLGTSQFSRAVGLTICMKNSNNAFWVMMNGTQQRGIAFTTRASRVLLCRCHRVL